jgi:hypothetical protein
MCGVVACALTVLDCAVTGQCGQPSQRVCSVVRHAAQCWAVAVLAARSPRQMEARCESCMVCIGAAGMLTLSHVCRLSGAMVSQVIEQWH